MNKHSPVPAHMRANLNASSTLAWLGRIRGFFGGATQANGRRSLYDTFGWQVTVSHVDFVNKYIRQDITKRIINAPVNALWSDPPKVEGDDAFNKAWGNLLEQIPVFHEIQRADILAGLGRYSILLVGLDDGRDLAQPIRRKEGSKVIYLQPYAEGSVTIKTWDRNPRSVRFGLPESYEISPGTFLTQVNTETGGTATVENVNESSFIAHWSRVIHIAEGALESKVFGHSRLEGVYNVLDDIMKVTGGSAETYWLAGNRGLHVDVDKDADLGEEDANNLSDEVDEYANELRRVIRTRGVKINALGSDVADPRGTFDVQLSLLAANTGIPKRVLMGSEAGQLASQQDRANWAIQVEMRISSYGQPTVLIPFIRTLIDIGVLPVPKQLSITWPDAFKMNPLERAQTSAQMARSAANLSKTLKTVEEINQLRFNNARATFESAGGGGFASGFGANAGADSSSEAPEGDQSASSSAAGQPPEEGHGSPQADPTAAPPGMIARPALIPGKPEKLVLLTEDECRSIIGFGKHMPVFTDDGVQESGSGAKSDTSATADVADVTV
jgi:uncharacterized protein